MKNRLFAFLLIPLLFFHTGCATFLSSNYQKVGLNVDSDTEVILNEKVLTMSKGKYLLPRTKFPLLLTLKKEGKRDLRVYVYPFKTNPMAYLSIVPFIVVYGLPLLDFLSPKSKSYPRNFVIQEAFVDEFEKKADDAKSILINKVKVDLDENALNFNTVSFRDYYNNPNKEGFSLIRNSESLKIQNTVFSNYLNEFLADKGYIDTSQNTLKSSYLNNIYIDASITGMDQKIIRPNSYSSVLRMDLVIEWKLRDFYKEVLFTKTTTSSSGLYTSGDDDLPYREAIEMGFLNFIENSECQEIIYGQENDIAAEAGFDPIELSAKTYITSVEEAIESSITVTNDEGHGSGFLISSDGYFITNYHVIAESEEINIETFKGEKFKAELVRSSKIYDLALLKIIDADREFQALKIHNSETFNLADDIYVIGTPSGEDLAQSVTKGILSGKRLSNDKRTLLQTDASVNSGNSGGAMLSEDGVVKGIVSSKLMGYGVEGVAFGIPAIEILNKLRISQKQ